ncbi:hypothetical protein J6S55_02915 [Candidatus Saccharibacteria bacterium]|nr:hypothetical protein [Candidatus Saccharibacteria bacterium]
MDNQKIKIIYDINPKYTNSQIKNVSLLGLIPFVGFFGIHDSKVGRSKAYKYHIITAIFTIISIVLACFFCRLLSGLDDSGSLAKMENQLLFKISHPLVAPFVAIALLGLTWHIPECINLFRISKNKYPIKNLVLIFCLMLLLAYAMIVFFGSMLTIKP